MRSPSPGKRDCSKSSKLAFYDVKTQPSLWPAHYHEQLWPHRCQHTYSSLYFKSHEMRHLKWKFRFLTLSVWYNRKGLAVSWKSLFLVVETCPLKARVIFIILANRKIKKGLCQSITCRPQSVLAIFNTPHGEADCVSDLKFYHTEPRVSRRPRKTDFSFNFPWVDHYITDITVGSWPRLKSKVSYSLLTQSQDKKRTRLPNYKPKQIFNYVFCSEDKI